MNKNLSVWVHSTRPKTLPASLAPVLIGTSIAFYLGKFDLLLFVLISISAILIQICTNFINDIYDFRKGADNKNRIGPRKALSTGEISLKNMILVTILLMIITFFIGLIIVKYSSWWILLIGVLSLLFAWAYTGGPFPLAYNGVAEPAVFVFFGVIATNGTIYALANEVTIIGLIGSAMPGLLSTTLLMVNNIRDIDNDKTVGKNTLAVKMGKKNSSILYALLHILNLFISILLAFILNSYFALIPLLSLPLNIKAIKQIYSLNGRELNKTLALNGALLIINGILTSLTFILCKLY